MPDGYPAGNPPSTITFGAGIVSISLSEGTSAGTTLTVTGFGFGVDTTDFDLFHEESSQVICKEKEIVEYGVFTCLTIPLEIAQSDTLKVKIGTEFFGCTNT